MRVNTYYPGFPRSHGGVGYNCQSIVDAMEAAGAEVSMTCVTVERTARKPFHRLVFPPWAMSIGYRSLSSKYIEKLCERKYLRSFSKPGIAYVWPGASLNLLRRLRSDGHTMVTECINSHDANGKAILDAEYDRLGVTQQNPLTAQKVAEENLRFALADLMFSPSSEVTKSLKNAGIPDEKILRTSYGLRNSDMVGEEILSSRATRKELTAIFVGRIGIRKGVHLLLDYWVRSGVTGTLKLVGQLEPDARPLIEPYLKRADIQHVSYTTNVKPVFEQADVFILPSLEEGSPLVTYQALGAGLPSLVSPMGGGGVIDHGIEGLVNIPHDADAWVAAIRRLFTDHDFRHSLGQNAYRKAPSYLYTEVGRQRLQLLRSRIDTLNRDTACVD